MSRYKCKHCPASTWSTLDAAFLTGWRIWSGTTVSGKQAEDVVCPACAGTAEPPPEPEPGWSVRCRTCDWMWEDEYGEGPLDAKEAKAMARDHECEPWVEICPPNSETWTSPSWVKDDGTVNEPVRHRAKVGVS